MTDLDFAFYIIISLVGGVLAVGLIWLGVLSYEETRKEEKKDGRN